MQFESKLTLSGILLTAWYATATEIAGLPPQDHPPARHWPLWLRILAVIAVLLFVRIVGGSMRGGPGGPGPTPKDRE